MWLLKLALCSSSNHSVTLTWKSSERIRELLWRQYGDVSKRSIMALEIAYRIQSEMGGYWFMSTR